MPANSQNYGDVLKELGYGIQEDCKIDCLEVILEGNRVKDKTYFGIQMGDTPSAVEQTIEDFFYINSKAIKIKSVKPSKNKENRITIVLEADDAKIENLKLSLISINTVYKRQ